MQELSGFLKVDKSPGWTSFDVVNRVRSQLIQRTGLNKIKVGHSGTLDPFASGLLILAIGSSQTKQLAQLSGLDKCYQASMKLGYSSDTLDLEGEIIKQPPAVPPTEDQVEECRIKFVGSIQQTPPAFSAIKVKGQRAYKLARAGKTVKLDARSVEVHELNVTNYDYPELAFDCHVSSGTYVRQLASDLARCLSTFGYLQKLCRTAISRYGLDRALTTEQLDADTIIQSLRNLTDL